MSTVQVIDGLTPALAGFAATLDDMQTTLEVVAERAFYPIMQEVFDSEGRGQWKPLQPAYASRKRERWGDKPIGQASGALVRSLTRKGAAYNVHISIGRNTLLVGSSLPHARYFNAQRPIELTARDEERMREAAAEDLKERARDAGFEVR